MGMLLGRRAMPCRHKRLPSAYQEVEYIQSTGTQYIKTGIDCPDTYTEITIQFMNDTAFPSIGAGTWNYGWRYVIARASNAGLTYDIRDNQGLTYKNTFDTEKHTIKFYSNDNHSVKFDDNLVGIFYGNNDLTSLAEIYLFSGHGSNGAEYYSKSRIYSCKMIKKDGSIVRNFVPCYRKADGVSGLFDLISNKFFTNDGTGTFIRGGDV